MIKKTLSILFGLSLLLFSSLTQAAESASTALSQLLKNMHSLQADFTQTIIEQNGKTSHKSKGHMMLQRPNQFRWDVLQPNRQLIVTNGKRLWIYEPELEQVTIRALAKAAGDTPAMLLSDENLSLAKEFFVQAAPSASLDWFVLTPKDKSSMIASLKLGFDDNQIHEMQLQDHLGHTTRIQFSRVQLNFPIAASFFTFMPPAQVDVIDETKR